MKRTYDDVVKEVNQITDKLGMPVDTKIKKSVVALRLCDFTTSGSCEGHLNRGSHYPWVDIYAPEQKEEHWIQANKNQRQRLSKLIEDFYKTSTYHHKFGYEDIGIFGGFRLVNSGTSPTMKSNAVLLKEYQEDFDSFADFLLRK